jgi:hypothetical protein
MSKFNEKWFNYMNNINAQETVKFNDFIFKDDFKRTIKVTKITDILWIFTIEFSIENNESYYFSILKNNICNDNEKTWFEVKNPTLQKINFLLSNINICKFHINCGKTCDLDMINTYKETCPICYSDFDKHYLTKTICNHYFCLPCLNKLVENHRKNLEIDDNEWYIVNCPVCRQNLSDI